MLVFFKIHLPKKYWAVKVFGVKFRLYIEKTHCRNANVCFL